MSVYSIKDLEHLSGIKAHTIRIWEQRYELFSPDRTPTNIRYYKDADLKLILNIAILKNHGYRISKIVSLPQEMIEQKVLEVNNDLQTNDDQINALTLSMIDLNEDSFSVILEKSIDRIGFEKTMSKLMYPFMRKIGILWLTNSINPAQEHFITHLVRQKIITYTNHIKTHQEGCLFLLFLPEGELHELGLLFANYLLRARGIKTIFFGQTVPIDGLEEVYHKLKPDYLLTAMTTQPETKDIQHYITNLGKRFEEAQILITGNNVLDQSIELPRNTTLVHDFDELLDLVSNTKVTP